MAGIRSNAAASNLLDSACAWRSASSCSRSVRISSSVRSWVRSGPGVGSVSNRTYNLPPSLVLAKVPRLTLWRTAPSLMPNATAASLTDTRRWYGVGSSVRPSPTRVGYHPLEPPCRPSETILAALSKDMNDAGKEPKATSFITPAPAEGGTPAVAVYTGYSIPPDLDGGNASPVLGLPVFSLVTARARGSEAGLPFLRLRVRLPCGLDLAFVLRGIRFPSFANLRDRSGPLVRICVERGLFFCSPHTSLPMRGNTDGCTRSSLPP
jgi:hypothetical protein